MAARIRQRSEARLRRREQLFDQNTRCESVQLLHNGLVIGRRQFLEVSAAAPAVLRTLAAGEEAPPGLNLEYEISGPPPTPPGLLLDAPARAVIEFSGAGVAAHCSLGVRVTLEGEPCVLPLAVWTGDRHAYWRFREAFRLPAFRGDVSWSGNRWSLAIAGRHSFSARPGPAVSEAPGAGPSPPWLAYRYALAADWTQGPLGEGPAQLWSVRSEARAPLGALSAGACETEGDMDGWLTKLGASGPVAARAGGVRTAPRERFEREVDRVSFEPFAFRIYTGGSFGVPLDTAFATTEALDAYGARREIRLSGLIIVSVDCFANPTVIEALLPPPCVPSQNPALRVLGLRGLEDPRLDEAWLLAECSLASERVWYAVSHVRDSLRGTAYGREVLGYPTKGGYVQALLGGNRFAASVSRRGKSAYQAHGSYGGFSTGTTLTEMTVANLRLRPASGSGPRAGEIVTQRWYYQGLRKPVFRASLDASFPAADRSDGRDPWNRMGPVQAYAAMVMDGAGMQRLPGKVAAVIKDAGPYYRDRCDGRLPWESPPSEGRQAASD